MDLRQGVEARPERPDAGRLAGTLPRLVRHDRRHRDEVLGTRRRIRSQRCREPHPVGGRVENGTQRTASRRDGIRAKDRPVHEPLPGVLRRPRLERGHRRGVGRGRRCRCRLGDREPQRRAGEHEEGDAVPRAHRGRLRKGCDGPVRVEPVDATRQGRAGSSRRGSCRRLRGSSGRACRRAPRRGRGARRGRSPPPGTRCMRLRRRRPGP